MVVSRAKLAEKPRNFMGRLVVVTWFCHTPGGVPPGRESFGEEICRLDSNPRSAEPGCALRYGCAMAVQQEVVICQTRVTDPTPPHPALGPGHKGVSTFDPL